MNVNPLIGALARNPRDEEAWELLYHRYWPLVMAWSFQWTKGDADHAADIAQDTFFRLVRYCDFTQFDGEPAFEKYLYAVWRSAKNDFWTKLLRRPTGEDERGFERAAAELASVDEDLVAEAMRTELLGLLAKQDEEILNMVIGGFTIAEVADRFGMTYSNAGVRIHRIRKKLRKYLSQKGIEF